MSSYPMIRHEISDQTLVKTAAARLSALCRNLSSHSSAMAPTRKECEYLVLGLGSGGVASARRAAGMYDIKTIAIESKLLGGTCVNVGHVPTDKVCTPPRC